MPWTVLVVEQKGLWRWRNMSYDVPPGTYISLVEAGDAIADVLIDPEDMTRTWSERDRVLFLEVHADTWSADVAFELPGFQWEADRSPMEVPAREWGRFLIKPPEQADA